MVDKSLYKDFMIIIIIIIKPATVSQTIKIHTWNSISL